MAEEEEGLLSMTSSANLTVNPFETASLDSLHLPAFSPSVFKASQDTPCSKKKGGFRWSIDQMSLLYPADIDELPQQQDASFIPKEKEEQVQEAINQFFSQKVVMPSPWSESKPMKHVTFSPKPPTISVLNEHSAENSLCSSTNGSFLGSLSGKVDVSCQTAITLPLNFDLEAFLGKGRFMYTKTSVESFPVAPLRRKLFTQSESTQSSGSNGLPSASPLSASSRESGPFSPSISPIKSSQESSPVEHIPRTPNSVESQFSSSPIARFRTTPLRPAPHLPLQASPLCGKMVSPLMSPIRETPQGSGLPRSPTTHDPIESLSTGDHVSPVIIKGNSLYHHARPSENMMDTSLSKAGMLDFRPQMADVGRGGGEGDKGIERKINFSPDSRGTREHERDGSGAIERREELSPGLIGKSDSKEEFDPGLIIEFDENDGEEELLMESRKDFTLGLTREFSPIQKIGDHISTLDEPGCSSRLHGTQEESSMDTSLMSNRGQLRESIHASSPPRTNIPCDFSLEASTALSPIPKTGDLSLSLQLSPVRAGAEETKDGVEVQSFRPKGRHKMVSFHIGTEFSPIRYPETGSDHISGQAMPITSSRVHESNTELLMETSLFSLDGQNERDESERVENLGADNAVKVAKLLRSSPQEDVPGPRLGNKVPDGKNRICNEQNYLESSSEGLQQNFEQTTPKEVMKRVGMDHHPLLHERKDEYVTTGMTDTASSQYPPMFLRTSSVRHGATSSCSRSCESCDHSSACWVADWTSSSLKREVRPGERWNQHSPTTPTACLTSTMRYGTSLFGQPPRSDQSATPSMNFSSVSLIANASSTKEDLPSHQAIDHTCDMTDGSVQQESSKNLRFEKVQFYDRVEDCRMQTSFKKAITSSMTTSRSYDSLRKYAQEKENTSAQEDWLMTSLSEADLQSRTSSEVQDMMAERDSVGTTSTSFVQHGVNEHGVLVQQGRNTSASFIQHGVSEYDAAVQQGRNTSASYVQHGESEHGAAAQQGRNTHSVCHRSISDPLQYQDSEMQEGSNSLVSHRSHVMKGVQEGSTGMSNNFETPCIHKVPENGSASKLHQKLYPITNAQEDHISVDVRTKDVSPLRPISVNLLSHITRTGVDSGYNTNSANVSMDIGEMENSS